MSLLNVWKVNESFTDELMKEADRMMDAMGFTGDDFEKTSASVPDENNPGAFENKPEKDDDLSYYVQVPFPGGWSQSLISGYLNRRFNHISVFPRPLKETGDKIYCISSAPGKGLGMFAMRKIKMGDLIADKRHLMVVSLSPGGFLVAPPKEGATQEGKYLLDHSKGVKLIPNSTTLALTPSLQPSCSPNTHRKLYTSSFSIQLCAARDIEEGEGILTNYASILLPAVERAEALMPYGMSDPARPDARIDPALQTLARIHEEGPEASQEYYKTLHQLYNAYIHQNDDKKALMYGEKLWVANLAAGEKGYEAFRNVELMKKSPQWMVAKMMRGLPVVRSFI
ncbi:hypothetical protein DFS33DRAFT_1490363 [Desarmillaria ectypa]|nr:hypothetical protein DFS33DRAFT_1490363 [Desarmillaria ectypa]